MATIKEIEIHLGEKLNFLIDRPVAIRDQVSRSPWEPFEGMYFFAGVIEDTRNGGYKVLIRELDSCVLQIIEDYRTLALPSTIDQEFESRRDFDRDEETYSNIGFFAGEENDDY
jgi:hypothetical protein